MAALRIHVFVTAARSSVSAAAISARGRNGAASVPVRACVCVASAQSVALDSDAAEPMVDPEMGGAEVSRGTGQGIVTSDEKTGRKGFTRAFFPRKGQELELFCESLAFKGMGVCKVAETGFVVLCERALPGERLVARVISKKRGFAQAYKVRTLSPHDNAVPAPCAHFGNCGGCKTQNLAYSAQLELKREQVQELISRLGKFGLSPDESPDKLYVGPIVPCESQYHYRNKMEFSCGTQEWIPADVFEKSPAPADPGEAPKTGSKSTGVFALGLHAPGRFDKIISIQKCLLQHELANEVLATVRRYCEDNRHDMPAYDEFSKQGFLRHLMIRSGRDCKTGEVQLMVVFVTKEYKPRLLQPLVSLLTTAFPQVVSIINNVNSLLGNTSFGEQEYLLHGVPTITAMLRGLIFEISSSSFFQPNTGQAEVLYKLVEDACSLRADGSEVLLDLFCGTGTIGLTMAQKLKHVYGYELVPEAVADARRNAKRNSIHNATFVEGDLNKLSADFGRDLPQPDVVVIDPNRPGLHLKLVQFLLKLRAPRIVYVSCNPATLARDLDLLCHGDGALGITGAYRLVSVVPVDMFPHTPHIECVSVLTLCP